MIFYLSGIVASIFLTIGVQRLKKQDIYLSDIIHGVHLLSWLSVIGEIIILGWETLKFIFKETEKITIWRAKK